MCLSMHARHRVWSSAAALLATLMLSLPTRASDDAPTLAALAFPPGQVPLGKFDEQGGEALYRTICQGCHMPDARGAQGAGAYPALASNPRLATGAYPAAIVLGGRHAMPPFGNSLSDQQIADVVNYVRSHFGNRRDDAMAAEDVATLRAALGSPAP